MAISGLKKEDFSIYLGVKITESSKNDLDKYCEKNNATQSEVIRFAINKLVSKK